jgi:hypothetical protein
VENKIKRKEEASKSKSSLISPLNLETKMLSQAEQRKTFPQETMLLNIYKSLLEDWTIL